MKRFPQIDRFFTAVCSFLILAIFVLLTSCEKESLQDDFSRIKASNLSTAAFVSEPNNNVVDCPYPSVCIVEGSGEYYVQSGGESKTSGANSKTVNYNVYNTETEFIIEVKYNTTGPAAAPSRISIDATNIGGDPEIFNLAIGASDTYVISLPTGWKSCDVINFNIHQVAGGSPLDINGSYSLIGICPSSCEESFRYEENQNGSYTFTYVSNEDLEDAEVKFTCPHISDFDGFEELYGKTYEVNPGNSQGSPTVLTWTGDIEACTEITFTLAFEADCAQTNSGKANLFTDFKVNGESKKGDNENIVYQCN